MSASIDIQKIYIGYFGRAGDPGGLNYWVGRYNGGASLDQIANTFAVQPEATSLYAWLGAPNLNVGIAEFITEVYQNLFNRNPEPAGLAFWTQYLTEKGVGSAGVAIQTIINSAQGSDVTTLNNKATVANYYTSEFQFRQATWGNDDLADARAVVADVDATAASVTAGKQLADQLITADLTPTPPPAETITLTTNIDILTIGGQDTVVGNSATFNEGDQITGSSGTVELFFNNSNESGTLTNLDKVIIRPDGVVNVNAKNWEDIDEIEVNEVDNGSNFKIEQIQGSIPDVFLNDVQAGSTVTTHYDGQDLNANGKVVNTSVREFNGTLLIKTDANSATQTINLDVEDTAGFESTMEDLEGQGTEKLDIDGGAAGINFKILGALDATIKTLDASGLASNASLNVSASTQTMNIDMGSGNDTLTMGDTLVDDDLNGGAGNDRVIAVFTDQTTRTPTMVAFETLEATFNSTVTFDGAKVDGLQTIDLNASVGRADFNRMDSTLKTLNILGNPAQGLEVDYDGKAFAELTVNVLGKTNAIGNAGNDYAIQVINADVFAFNHNGTEDLDVDDGIRVDDNFTGRHTTDVTITNNSVGDLDFDDGFPDSVIVDGNTVERLTIRSTNTGDIDMEDGDDLMEEAAGLQVYTVESATDSDLTLGDVGDVEAATDLEQVDITIGISSDSAVGEVDARDGNGAATIDQINITLKSSAVLELFDDDGEDYWLQAGSVNRMTVVVGEGADLFGDNFDNFPAMIGLDLEQQAGNSLLKISGPGDITGFIFDEDNFSTVDASGLTGDGIIIDHDSPNQATAFKFVGSGQDDIVNATWGADTLLAGGGNDSIFGDRGNDSIEGGAGADELIGWRGNDVIKGDAGNDFIDGGWNAAANSDAGLFGDTLAGGTGNDEFFFDITLNFQGDQLDTFISTEPNGLMQDVILDFSAAGDFLTFAIGDNPDPVLSNLDEILNEGFAIAKVQTLNGLLEVGVTGDQGPLDLLNPDYAIRIVLTRGDYNADGTFNVSNTGDDLQLLVKEDGEAFDPLNALLNPAGFFGEADVLEIGLLNAGNQFGSINTSDFNFIA